MSNEVGRGNLIEGIFWIIIVIIAGIVIFKLVTRNKKKDLEEKEDTREEIISRIKDKLREIEKKYEKKFLAYAMYREARSRDLHSDIVKKIFSEYGKVLGKPSIKFLDEMGVKEFIYFNDAAFEYLQDKNFNINKSISASSNFINYMLEKATRQAKKEIEKFIKQENSTENS